MRKIIEISVEQIKDFPNYRIEKEFTLFCKFNDTVLQVKRYENTDVAMLREMPTLIRDLRLEYQFRQDDSAGCVWENENYRLEMKVFAIEGQNANHSMLMNNAKKCIELELDTVTILSYEFDNLQDASACFKDCASHYAYLVETRALTEQEAKDLAPTITIEALDKNWVVTPYNVR